MRTGFYVSPCGNHIIEVSCVRNSRHFKGMVVDFKNSHMIVEGPETFHHWKILLSCWQYLENSF